MQQDVTAANLYHLVSDFLEGGITAEVGWSRVKSLFSSRSQADYLAEVDQAESPSALEDIVMKYVWNLRVLEHALSTLTERFPERACILVDFVGERVWAPASATPEARSAVSHYLFTCLPERCRIFRDGNLKFAVFTGA